MIAVKYSRDLWVRYDHFVLFNFLVASYWNFFKNIKLTGGAI